MTKELLEEPIIAEAVARDRQPIGLDEPFSFECRRCGACCRESLVSVNSYDIYRLLANQYVRSLGIRTTMDLHKGRYLRVMRSTTSGLPICIIRFRGADDPDMGCPFLRTTGRDSTECLVHSDRPTVCRSLPIVRLSRKESEEGVYYCLPVDSCVGCEVRRDTPSTLREWLQASKVQPFYQNAELHRQRLNRLLASKVLEGSQREGVFGWMARILFDYDALVEPGSAVTLSSQPYELVEKAIDQTLGACIEWASFVGPVK